MTYLSDLWSLHIGFLKPKQELNYTLIHKYGLWWMSSCGWIIFDFRMKRYLQKLSTKQHKHLEHWLRHDHHEGGLLQLHVAIVRYKDHHGGALLHEWMYITLRILSSCSLISLVTFIEIIKISAIKYLVHQKKTKNYNLFLTQRCVW